MHGVAGMLCWLLHVSLAADPATWTRVNSMPTSRKQFVTMAVSDRQAPRSRLQNTPLEIWSQVSGGDAAVVGGSAYNEALGKADPLDKAEVMICLSRCVSCGTRR